MPRYGHALKVLKKLISNMDPDTKFKARDLSPEITSIVGYKISSKNIGQYLTKLRSVGIVEKADKDQGIYNWRVTKKVVILREA
jgi:hypothetical protein